MLPTDKNTQVPLAPQGLLNRRKRSKEENRARLLYIPTVILWAAGLVMTFCSAVQPIGETTVFWQRRELFVIIGPVTLGLAVIALMGSVAVIHRKRQQPQTVKIVCAPSLENARPYHKRTLSYASDRIVTQQCPQCKHRWFYPTDIKIDVTRGDTEKCHVYISDRTSPTMTNISRNPDLSSHIDPVLPLTPTVGRVADSIALSDKSLDIRPDDTSGPSSWSDDRRFDSTSETMPMLLTSSCESTKK